MYFDNECGHVHDHDRTEDVLEKREREEEEDKFWHNIELIFATTQRRHQS